ncbi:hypothetical protein [Nannocystis pusilla]|uniref:hypothetical protein n=1 Tax=Nannocystis pusilla TaxID=889268 RepID=UPI003B778A9F
MRAHLDLVRGAHDDAIVRLRGVLLNDLAGDTWWVRERRAGVLLLLGLHLRARGDLAAARTALQAAIDDFVAVAATTSSVVSDQQLARARVAHAELAILGPPIPIGRLRLYATSTRPTAGTPRPAWLTRGAGTSSVPSAAA